MSGDPTGILYGDFKPTNQASCPEDFITWSEILSEIEKDAQLISPLLLKRLRAGNLARGVEVGEALLLTLDRLRVKYDQHRHWMSQKKARTADIQTITLLGYAPPLVFDRDVYRTLLHSFLQRQLANGEARDYLTELLQTLNQQSKLTPVSKPYLVVPGRHNIYAARRPNGFTHYMRDDRQGTLTLCGKKVFIDAYEGPTWIEHKYQGAGTDTQASCLICQGIGQTQPELIRNRRLRDQEQLDAMLHTARHNASGRIVDLLAYAKRRNPQQIRQLIRDQVWTSVVFYLPFEEHLDSNEREELISFGKRKGKPLPTVLCQ